MPYQTTLPATGALLRTFAELVNPEAFAVLAGLRLAASARGFSLHALIVNVVGVIEVAFAEALAHSRPPPSLPYRGRRS